MKKRSDSERRSTADSKPRGAHDERAPDSEPFDDPVDEASPSRWWRAIRRRGACTSGAPGLRASARAREVAMRDDPSRAEDPPTLLDLVIALREATSRDDLVVAAVSDLLRSGRVRLLADPTNG